MQNRYHTVAHTKKRALEGGCARAGKNMPAGEKEDMRRPLSGE